MTWQFFSNEFESIKIEMNKRKLKIKIKNAI